MHLRNIFSNKFDGIIDASLAKIAKLIFPREISKKTFVRENPFKTLPLQKYTKEYVIQNRRR